MYRVSAPVAALWDLPFKRVLLPRSGDGFDRERFAVITSHHKIHRLRFILVDTIEIQKRRLDMNLLLHHRMHIHDRVWIVLLVRAKMSRDLLRPRRARK